MVFAHGRHNMAVNLRKGQKVDLTKGNPGLTKLMIGLGWDVNRYDGSEEFDLDASAFLLGVNGRVTSDADFIFYGNQKHHSSCIESTGDNRSGAGDGDDEQLIVNLSLVPSNIEKIAFVVTIYDAETRRQNFGMVNNAYIRVLDQNSNQEIVRFDLGEDFSIETALVLGELYRHNGEWKFNAVGSGFQGGLEALCTNFGVNV